MSTSPFTRFRQIWHHRALATQILIWVLCILLATVSLGGYLYSRIANDLLDQQYQQRALGIAITVAQMPQIPPALQSGDPQQQIQELAQKVTAEAHPAYVVVTNRDGIRFSHPNLALLGKKLEEPVVALDGQSHLGSDSGSLGKSANARTPIRDAAGNIVGQVSVGILETTEQDELITQAWLIAGFSASVLILSAFGSLLLARRIKKVTFGLEPAEIASLLQEREALLHGIREGMLGVDDDDRVTVINEEARRLLEIEGTILGTPLLELFPPGRLRDILTGRIDGVDQVALTDSALLVVNRMPVTLAGTSIGSVITLRDRTEIESLIKDLHSTQGLMNALRAQEHEYANRLHIVAGLLELGEQDQARAYVGQIADTPHVLAERLRTRISPPELVALLLAKITVAAEQDIQIVVDEDSNFESAPIDTSAILTIVGNLLDNAIDALAHHPGERVVTINLDDADGAFIKVTDTGPGIPAEKIDQVLLDGYSTKEARPGMRRGIGLALVSRIVRRYRGTFDLLPGPGGHFEIWLPDASGHQKTEEISL
ncbi:ATP-binding protein [Psychromicrobium xiongbiense]|uniref:ATP-binding protein n=1 Tax=Psychromicrobium xiongbiense TaxID=3051184 RepID=UPI0025527912|nr:sensor histidine kinase [Psychromicrobium sp. YIM S02556]